MNPLERQEGNGHKLSRREFFSLFNPNKGRSNPNLSTTQPSEIAETSEVTDENVISASTPSLARRMFRRPFVRNLALGTVGVLGMGLGAGNIKLEKNTEDNFNAWKKDKWSQECTDSYPTICRQSEPPITTIFDYDEQFDNSRYVYKEGYTAPDSAMLDERKLAKIDRVYRDVQNTDKPLSDSDKFILKILVGVDDPEVFLNQTDIDSVRQQLSAVQQVILDYRNGKHDPQTGGWRRLVDGLMFLGGVLFVAEGVSQELARTVENKRMRSIYSLMYPTAVEPTQEVIDSFRERILYLPPVGMKVLGNANFIPTPMKPTNTAEELVTQVDNDKDIRMLHQFTVQGRLSDRAKYIALALILRSEFHFDWSKPLFDAPWGKIGPLIHDGGKVNTEFNSIWNGVSGRTDYYRLLASTATTTDQPQPRLSLSQEETERVMARYRQRRQEALLLDFRAFQRLALALHAFQGTLPHHIPEVTAVALKNSWEDFESKMRRHLGEYDVEGLTSVAWFTEQPRKMPGWKNYGLRQEGDWEPIKEQLIQLENIRWQYPQLADFSTSILVEYADQVDEILGLKE